MCLNIRKFLLLMLCCLSLTACTTVTEQKSVSTVPVPAIVPATKVVTKDCIGEKIEVGLGKLIASDVTDQQIVGSLAKDTLDHSLDNEVVTWNNPTTGRSGSLQIIKTEGLPAEQLVCRQFNHTLVMNDAQEIIHGKACRGMWDPKQPWVLYE